MLKNNHPFTVFLQF